MLTERIQVLCSLNTLKLSFRSKTYVLKRFQQFSIGKQQEKLKISMNQVKNLARYWVSLFATKIVVTKSIFVLLQLHTTNTFNNFHYQLARYNFAFVLHLSTFVIDTSLMWLFCGLNPIYIWVESGKANGNNSADWCEW